MGGRGRLLLTLRQLKTAAQQACGGGMPHLAAHPPDEHLYGPVHLVGDGRGLLPRHQPRQQQAGHFIHAAGELSNTRAACTAERTGQGTAGS